ncbi:MAG: ABC transporter ATP-binding protein [Candidatus Riflebacteria bacterium]|nr:ABC transporter ATP-binding protein [Candidatus Riflebacteria bacterium]
MEDVGAVDPVPGREPNVVLKSVVKRFGDLVAVDHVDLAVYPGEFFGLLGPNGAGKSTIIKIATGLWRPTSGEVKVLGVDLEQDSLAVKARVGLLPEDLNLYERLTGEEYLQFAGRMYRLPENDVISRSRQLLEVLELANKANQLIIDYSQGMKKKIGLAAALIHNPTVLFLDEPFNGVDVVSSRTVRQILQRLVERGVTVFFSSHVMEMVEKLCNRVAILKKGRIVAMGTVEELKRSAGAAPETSLEDIFLAHIGETEESQPLPWIG